METSVRPFLAFLLLALPLFAHAATLEIDVRDAKGAAVRDAVVYAVPEGRPVAPSRQTAVMDQKNRMFVPHVLPVQTGTAVRFPNSDDIRHQVYSFSEAKTFQLPLYTGMPANPVIFDKPGVATLGCNIHDRMTAYIVVVDTPHFGATGKSGHVTLSNLASGKYTVTVWHPDLHADAASVPVALGGSERLNVKFSMR
jgi:plastocyanin